MTETRSDEDRDATGESRDERGRLMGVRVDGAWFYRHVPGRYQELRDEVARLRAVGEALAPDYSPIMSCCRTAIEHASHVRDRELRSLRGVVQAVEALAAENEAWYASDRKTITTRELRAALAAAADAPQLQPAKVTPCWKHDLWDPACYECVDGDGESPLHDERCDEGCVEK